MGRILQFVWWEWIFLLLLLFVFLCSVYQLTEAPPTWYDEGMVVQLAMNVAQHGVVGTQVAPGVFLSGAFTSTGFPVVAPVAASFKFFGISLASARAVMVLYIILFICAAYYFLRQITGRTEALFSIGLLATFSTLYGDGKNVLGEIPGLFYFTLFLIFAHKIFDEGKATKTNAVIAGLCAGLCLATKPTFLVVAGAIFFALLYTYFFQKKAVPLPIVGYGVMATLVPFLVWLITQFNGQDSFSAVFSFYANPYQLQHIPSVMYQNLLRFFTESTPLYLLGMLLVIAVSAVMRFRRRMGISFAELTAFFFIGLIVLAYLRTPGWYRYLFPAQVVAALFFPIALGYVAGLFPDLRLTALARRGAVLLLVGMISVQSYMLFFHSWIAQYYRADTTYTLQEYFKTWDSRTTVFVYDIPQLPLFLPLGAHYYQYISLGRGAYGLGTNELAVIDAKIPDVLLVPSEKANVFPGYHETDRVKGVVVLTRGH